MSTVAPVSADIVFDKLFAYQQTAALKAAIDLEVFTAIDEGARTPDAIAARTKSSERGIRILCDFLTTVDLIEKSDGLYALTPTSAAFLSKRSQMYLGTMANFLVLPELKQNFDHLTETVRTGSVRQDGNTVSTENPIWLGFVVTVTDA